MRCKERSGLKCNLWQRREMHGESSRKNGLSDRRWVKEGGCFCLIHGRLLITDLYLFEGLILVKNIFLMVIKSFVWLQPRMERFVHVLLEHME